MKAYGITLIFFIACCALSLSQGTEEKHKLCMNSTDCDEDECCIVRGLIGFRKGRCKAMGKEGSKCSSTVAHFGFYGDKFYHFCPCKKGLICEVDEPKMPLKEANEFNIYNRCISGKDIEAISKQSNRTEEENKQKYSTTQDPEQINSTEDEL